MTEQERREAQLRIDSMPGRWRLETTTMVEVVGDGTLRLGGWFTPEELRRLADAVEGVGEVPKQRRKAKY